MDVKKFKRIVGPTARKIERKKGMESVGSFKSLKDLLVEWYERKLKQFQSKKRGGESHG